MSVRLKLFLIFLVMTLSLVFGMYGFIRWSLNKGFSEFMEKRHQERIENVRASLADYYEQHRSWDDLRTDKRQWFMLLWRANPHAHPHPPPELARALANPGSEWPPRLIPKKADNPRFVPFEFRAMLLDQDKMLIFGHPDAVRRLLLYPVRVDGRAVGFLGIVPGRPLAQMLEAQFLEEQGRALIVIAVGMVVVSAFMALLLAYLLGRPLKRLIAGINSLAKGRYGQRLRVQSNDELGRLARDINGLAAVLEQAEASRRRWIADVSHELRTPLSVLRGELEALQDGIRPLTPKAVDSLLADLMRLSRLTDDLYQLALSDQGALTYHKTALDPAALLADDLDALAAEFAAKNIAVDRSGIVSARVSVYGDPDRLAQLFRNILTNSLKYTDAGGALRIRCYRRDDRLAFDFSDSAPGVSEAEAARLFDRFYRVEASRSRVHGGAGLGLAICQNIAAAHQGRISASPSELGGLKIHVELPVM